MSSPVDFLRIQYLPDLFRAEPRNVGVVVRRGDEVRARFVGEKEPGKLDKRKVRHLEYPDVYEQWVEYWRRVIEEQGAEAFSELVATSGDHYRVLEGGEVTDTSDDPVEDVATYLYALLVSEGGLAEALRPVDAETELEEGEEILDKEIGDELKRLSILEEPEEQTSIVRYPVRRLPAIKGRRAARPHRPAYAQQNGRLDLIETLDFFQRNKPRTKDHAGWTAYMFDDVRKEQERNGFEVDAISVVKWSEELEDVEELSYAKSILDAEADRVVNWLNEEDRADFLASRRSMAFKEF